MPLSVKAVKELLNVQKKTKERKQTLIHCQTKKTSHSSKKNAAV